MRVSIITRLGADWTVRPLTVRSPVLGQNRRVGDELVQTLEVWAAADQGACRFARWEEWQRQKGAGLWCADAGGECYLSLEPGEPVPDARPDHLFSVQDVQAFLFGGRVRHVKIMCVGGLGHV